MTRERLSYILGKWVCGLRVEHSYGPKFRLAERWVKTCVICGHACETDKPKPRVERRTKD